MFLFLDEVWFEYCPSLFSGSHLLWVGDLDDRPNFSSNSTTCDISPKMDAALWNFARLKEMDECTFRALVEGRLPAKKSKPLVLPTPTPSLQQQQQQPETSSSVSFAAKEVNVTTSDGRRISVDEDTLAQAALLQQMKEKFGSTDACMQAIMTLMARENAKK